MPPKCPCGSNETRLCECGKTEMCNQCDSVIQK